MALLFIFFPYFAQQKGSRKDPCISCLNQMAKAANLYAMDFDDHLPPPHWFEAMLLYTRSEQTFTCPTLAERGENFGYAFHDRDINRKISKIADQSKEPIVFDSKLKMRNVTCNLYGVEDPPRHGRSNNFAMADCHSIPLTPAQLQALLLPPR